MDLRDRKTTKLLITLAYIHNTTEGREKKSATNNDGNEKQPLL
jgi:hypothetical protein